MKRLLLHAGLLLLLGAFAFAQDTPPKGTHQSPNEPNAVRPTKKAGKGVKSAPGNMGRGVKAAGHDVKEGHPVEAGKSIGEGTGRSAQNVGHSTAEGSKDVASGTKSGAKTVGHSVKKGVKKVTGDDEKKPETKSPPPQI